MSLSGSIAQVIFGYLAGDYIIKKGKTSGNGQWVICCRFAVFLFAGYAWDMVFPINKKIWTSSFTVYTTGLAMIILAVTIYMIEFKNYRGWWSKFFDVFGKNPLFIFVLSGLLPRLLGLDTNSFRQMLPGNLVIFLLSDGFMNIFASRCFLLI